MNDRKRDLTNDTDHPAAKAGTGALVGGAAGGIAGGAAAGAAAGGMTGPVGAVVGAAVGAVVGAVAGRTMRHDPVVEDNYWRDNYSSRPYVSTGQSYDDYAPAYRYGADAYSRYPNRSFDEVEPELSRDWGSTRGKYSAPSDDPRRCARQVQAGVGARQARNSRRMAPSEQ